MLMKIENTTAVAYFNNQGGTVSKELISLTQAGTYGCGAWGGIFTFKLSTYLPGVMNQAVEVHQGHIELEPRPLNLPKNQQTLWGTGSGHICFQTHQSVPLLLQLAARSICRGNRCIPPKLDDNQRLCQPPMESDSQGAIENTNTGSKCNPGSSCLEDTAMVPSPAVVGSRLAMSITQTDTQYRVSTHNAPTSRVEGKPY